MRSRCHVTSRGKRLPRAALKSEPMSLTDLLSMQVARVVPLPLPREAKMAVVKPIVEAAMPQVEAALPPEQRKALRGANTVDVDRVVTEASDKVIAAIPPNPFVSEEQKKQIVKQLLIGVVKGEENGLLETGKGGLALALVQTARASVNTDQKEALIDQIADTVPADLLVGKEAERAAIESVVNKVTEELEAQIPSELRRLIEVSSPKEFRRVKQYYADSIMEKVPSALPSDFLRPTVESAVSKVLDMLVEKSGVEQSEFYTKEELLLRAAAQVMAAKTESEILAQKSQSMAQRAGELQEELVAMEKKAYPFFVVRWWKRRQRRKLL